MSFLASTPYRAVGAIAFLGSLVGCGARTDVAFPAPAETDGGGVPPDASESSCPGLAPGPQVLATLGVGLLGPEPYTFAIGPDAIYVELGWSGNPHAIDRIPIGGGTPRAVVSGAQGCPSSSPFGAETPIVTDGSTLYMVGVHETAACEGSAPSVRTYDFATGVLGTIPAPAGTETYLVAAMRTTEAPGVYYLTGNEFDPSTSVLVHAEGTVSTVIATLPEWCFDFRIVGSRVFAIGAKSIYELGLDGSGVTAIQPVTFGMGAALLAANSTSVFFTLNGSIILRRDAATGATFTAATPPMLNGGAWADDRYLYFGAGEPIPQGVLRVPAGGGEVETFWSGERSIVDGTSVGCKVYWVTQPDWPAGTAPVVMVAPE